MGNAYLLVYNLSLWFGWGYCLYLTVRTLIDGGQNADVYKAVEVPLKVCQTAALLEVVHSALRIVRSPVAITAMQVASRIWLLWGIMVPFKAATTTASLPLFNPPGCPFTLSLGLSSLMVAWSLSEIIRYGFFALKEMGLPPYFALWLRYTGFIVLYPLGVSSELALVLLALPVIQATGAFSIQMPNKLNFACDYYVICILGMLTYIPGFPQLYFYMLKQRKKSLAPQKPKMQ